MDRSIAIIGSITAVVVVTCAVFFAAASQPGASSGSDGAIYFFYGEECPHCHNIMPLIINMSEKYPEANIRMLEIWHNQTNQAIYLSVHEQLNRRPGGVPEIVAGDVVLSGELEIPAKLEQVIQERLKR